MKPFPTSSSSPARWLRAFTLVELLVVIAVIGILASLLLPALGRAKESGRSAKCISNLRQIGLAVRLWTDDNENQMPVMRDAPVPPNTPMGPEPSPDIVLSNYVNGVMRIFECPSDDQQLFVQTRSSYAWNSLLNGQDADRLSLLGLPTQQNGTPLFYDKEGFHRGNGTNGGVNTLYADTHVSKQFTVEFE